MREVPNPTLADEFEALISAGEHNENALQAFIERHTAFLPTPSLLNHQLHLQSLISKFPIGDRKTDFAYLTKSSDRWKLVLVELESPAKPLFKASSNSANSAEFNDAVAQIVTWKEHWQDLRGEVERRLRPLLVPPSMAGNTISVEFQMVIGRAAEKAHDDARRRRLATIHESGIHVMTWDTLLDNYRAGRGEPKAVLTVNSNGYKLKHVERMPELMFAYVRPQHLKLSKEADKALRADGYAIDAWKGGALLEVNGKWPMGNIEEAVEEMADERMRSFLTSVGKQVAKKRGERSRRKKAAE
ncbi:MAG TPA: Shedu immune nuclease family protein [Allosphingosinicella sp.]|jgi:hypothetical protein|nr:Shedu immune nuclease family protein [Allosphingosinicella sp.]